MALTAFPYFYSAKLILQGLSDIPLYEERALFSRIAESDENAFRQLFELHKTSLYATALKLTKSDLLSEEMLQEVFLSLWVSREKLNEVDSPANYLYTILFNKVKSYFRQQTNHQRILKLARDAYAGTTENTTEDRVLAQESQRLIDEAIKQMPPQRKIVYQLSRQAGLSQEEIARKLNISISTVKSHMTEALKTIRAYLNKNALLLF